jgi:hypothetical protein
MSDRVEAESIYGHVELHPYFLSDVNGDLVGWGTSRHYNRNGVLIKEVTICNDITMKFEKPKLSKLEKFLLKLSWVG